MKITLCCAAGMSSGFLVKKIGAVAKERGIDLDIAACSIPELKDRASGSEAILIGPQVAYHRDKIAGEYPDIPVIVINMTDYGMQNGAKIFDEVLAAIKNKEGKNV
jgi:PTS system cellobiose-specific IIB component